MFIASFSTLGTQELQGALSRTFTDLPPSHTSFLGETLLTFEFFGDINSKKYLARGIELELIELSGHHT